MDQTITLTDMVWGMPHTIKLRDVVDTQPIMDETLVLLRDGSTLKVNESKEDIDEAKRR